MANTKQLSSPTRCVLIVNIGHYRRVVHPSAEVKDFSEVFNAMCKCRVPPEEDDADSSVKPLENRQPSYKKESTDITLHPIVESHEEKPSTPPPSPLSSPVAASSPAATPSVTPSVTPPLSSSQVEDKSKSGPPEVTQEPQHDRSIEGYNVEFLLGSTKAPVAVLMVMEDTQMKLFRLGITRDFPYEMIAKIYQTKEDLNNLIEEGHLLQSEVGLNLDVCLGLAITTFKKPLVIIFENVESLTEYLNDLKPHLFHMPPPDVTSVDRYCAYIENDIYNAVDVERSDIMEKGIDVRITLGSTHRVCHANVALNYDRQEIILTRNTKRGILPTRLILTTISEDATFETIIRAGDITDFASPDRRLGFVAQSFSHPFVIEFETRETMVLFDKHVKKMISSQEEDLGGSQNRRTSLSEPNVVKRARLAECHIESLIDSEFFTD